MPSATCILDTDFGTGATFVRNWQQWAALAAATDRLHYVGLAPSWNELTVPHASDPQTAQWAKALKAMGCAGALPEGFYRQIFDQGRVKLTLCIGPIVNGLRQFALQADSIEFSDGPHWDASALTLLTRRARPAAILRMGRGSISPNTQSLLTANAWAHQNDGTMVYQPARLLRPRRTRALQSLTSPGHCTVIGAGISGATVAYAMAQRGWRVQVLERDANAGSSLPVAMVSAIGSSPADPLFSLSRSAYHLTHQLIDSMLTKGTDWDDGGVLRSDDRASSRHRESGQSEGEPEDLKASALAQGWHLEPQALWVGAQSWIRACLAHPAVSVHQSREVQTLKRDGDQWLALDADGLELARSELMVLCNAMDVARLIEVSEDGADGSSVVSPALKSALQRSHAMYGSISSGPSINRPDWPHKPIQGKGHFLPKVPTAHGLRWFAGAGFWPTPKPLQDACHADNLARLDTLLPELTSTLAQQHEAGHLSLWQGQRFVSHDRLPLVGPVDAQRQSGLWVCSAMGARGFTWAALCAELLASRVCDEPLPLPKRLAQLLDAQRLQKRMQHPSI